MYAYFPQTTLRHTLCYGKVKDKDLTPFAFTIDLPIHYDLITG